MADLRLKVTCRTMYINQFDGRTFFRPALANTLNTAHNLQKHQFYKKIKGDFLNSKSPLERAKIRKLCDASKVILEIEVFCFSAD